MVATAISAGTAFVDVRPDFSGFGKQLSSGVNPHIDTMANNTKSKLGGAFKSVAGTAGGLFAAAGVASFFKATLAAADESNKISALTGQIIKATGGAAGLSADQVGKLADKLSKLTGIDDEVIQKSQNKLLTFKNLRNETGAGNAIFDRASAAVLDLSKVFGGTEQSALQVGKALNDPVAGITALGRAGVTFTDQQKEQIKTLVEAGDVLGAQKIILAEIEGQVGGTAEAAATPFDRLKVAVGNLQEELGKKLLPVIQKVATWMADHIPVVIGFAIVVGTVLVGAFIAWAISATAAAVATLAAVWPFILIGAAIVALAAGFIWLFQNNETFRTVVLAVWHAIQAAVSFAWNSILKPIFEALAWFFVNVIIPAAQMLWAYWTFLWNVISAVLTWAWNTIIKPIWDFIVLYITTILVPMYQFLWSVVQTVWNAIAAAITWAWNTIIKPIWDALKWYIDTVLVPVFHFLWNTISAVWDQISQKTTTIWNAVSDFIGGIIDKVSGAIRGGVGLWIKIMNTLIGAVNWILDKIGLPEIPRIPELAEGGALDVAASGRNFMASGGRVGGGFRTNGPRAIVGEGRRAYPEYVVPTDPRYRGRALGLFGALAGDLRLMAGGGNLNREEMTSLASGAGFGGEALRIALAIAAAESSWNPSASNTNSNGSIDRGLWQINSIHGALSTFDVFGNAAAAWQISSGGSNWNPWTVYKTGAYAKFLDSDPDGGGGGGLLGFFERLLGGSLESVFGPMKDKALSGLKGLFGDSILGTIARKFGDLAIDGIFGFLKSKEGKGGGTIGSGWQEVTKFLDSVGVPYSVNSTTGGAHAPGSFHYQGKAVDLGGDFGRIFDALSGQASSLAELFYSPAGRYVKNGAWVNGIFPDHYDHVHAATFDRGGVLAPGWNAAYNGTGSMEMLHSEDRLVAAIKEALGPSAGEINIYAQDTPTARDLAQELTWQLGTR